MCKQGEDTEQGNYPDAQYTVSLDPAVDSFELYSLQTE